jgi:phosphopantetheinyl transferase
MFLRLGAFEGGPVGRRAALLDFCADALGFELSRLDLTHDALGAPILCVDGAAAEWRVSSSSRENICLFGLARRRVGVDVEIGDGGEPAWNVLHRKERAALQALAPELRGQEFLRLWVAREAYLKALGVGLRREPSEICVRPSDEAFLLLDRGLEIATDSARAWRAAIGRREAICACVVLPDP